ncbi:MAG: 3-dehydroquinate synthase [Fimbriimonadaceae bacterium]|nr:3-dehydroquinate synthase [Chitinophagales bacterium]
METITLKEYKIYNTGKFSEQSAIENYIHKYSSVFVLTDTNTKKYCLPLVKQYLPEYSLLEIPAGETEKNIDTCKYLWNRLVELNADRKSLLINLGGGVIGDMGGFVASTFKRGFDFINIPTTLLSQVDASVGGKLGIDFNEMKNLIGVFNNPKAIFICPEFLQTLPHIQLRSGFAEVLKHGLITDKNYWNTVKTIDLNKFHEWESVIKRSVEIKKAVVEEDMYESGLRKILNFGHTIGHAVETLSLQNDSKPLLHGEAIAIGMICEAWLSNILNGLTENELNEIVSVIKTHYPKYAISNINFNQVMNIIKQDKKNVGDKFSFSLLKETGVCEFDKHVSTDLIKRSLEYYENLS